MREVSTNPPLQSDADLVTGGGLIQIELIRTGGDPTGTG
jgi:hypothetical protein